MWWLQGERQREREREKEGGEGRVEDATHICGLEQFGDAEKHFRRFRAAKRFALGLTRTDRAGDGDGDMSGKEQEHERRDKEARRTNKYSNLVICWQQRFG